MRRGDCLESNDNCRRRAISASPRRRRSGDGQGGFVPRGDPHIRSRPGGEAPFCPRRQRPQDEQCSASAPISRLVALGVRASRLLSLGCTLPQTKQRPPVPAFHGSSAMPSVDCPGTRMRYASSSPRTHARRSSKIAAIRHINDRRNTRAHRARATAGPRLRSGGHVIARVHPADSRHIAVDHR
jgi:hypothetical protein